MSIKDRPVKSSANPMNMGAAACPDCLSADPQVRHRHYLELFRLDGEEALRNHLTTQYVDLKPPETQRPDTVKDIIAWACGLREQWAGMAHPDTGAPLAWHEAREMTVAYDAARAATPQPAMPRSGALTVLLNRLTPLMARYPASGERAWAKLHLDMMHQGLAKQTAEACQARAAVYRMFARQYPDFAALCSSSAARCEEEAMHLDPQPAPASAEDDWAPYMTEGDPVAVPDLEEQDDEQF